MRESTWVLLLGALALAPVGARADEAACTRTLGQEIGKYMKARFKAIEKCEDKRSRGTLPAATVCRPQCGPLAGNAGSPCTSNAACLGDTCQTAIDPSTADKIGKAAAKAQDKIGDACGALPALPPIGPACDDAASGGAAGVGACITDPVQDSDVAALNADTLAETIYASDAPVADAGLQKCQQAIGKEVGKYLSARYKIVQKCFEALGPDAGCPDGDPSADLLAARSKLDAGIRKKCTEAQLAADADPQLEFAASCLSYKLTTFKRVGTTNDNSIPVLDRLIACLADAAAGVADRMIAIAYPGMPSGGFAQGVAAGDATDTSAVFWARLPDPNQGATLEITPEGGGTQTINVPAPAPGDDGTVKVEVGLLQPFTTYGYRFLQGGDAAEGSIRTAPALADAQTVRFAWTGDANAYFQPFSVLQPLWLQGPDAFFFIGDTIYGDDPRADGLIASTTDDYYAKYRSNRADPYLRRLMSGAGTYVMWDDHEVRNDFAGTVPAYATKLANGNHAFRRYYPIREDGGDPMRLYRSVRWGQLAEFFIIDVRQYRSAKYTCCNNAAEDGFVLVDDDSTCTTSGDAALPSPACSTALATPGRTVLGAAQKAWLKAGLQSSTATFKFIMNGPPITNLFFQPYDFWIGYPEERDELLAFILDPNGDSDQSDRIANTIWLSTDLHGIVISAERVSIGPSQTVPEVVSGAVGMDPIFRELPATIAPLLASIPGVLTQVTQFDIDRFNATLLTVAPGAPATAKLDFYDRSGGVIQTVTFAATP